MPNARFQNLAVFVDDGQLAAGAEAGVHPQGYFTLDGRLHQKLMQILGEHPDSGHVGAVCEFISDFPLHGGEEQPLPGVLAGQLHLPGSQAAGTHKGKENLVQRFFLRGF